MNLIMPFDSETSGLPEWKIPSDDPSQPHIVQLGSILVDEDTREVKERFDVLIKPDGWSWDHTCEAFKTHGITMERAMDEGVPEKDAIDELLAMWSKCGFRIGHNVNFDNRIVRIAIKRYFGVEIADKWKAGESKCTGLLSKKICKMPPYGRYGWKMPKLTEAYKFFTGTELENAHSAMADTEGCLAVYWGIVDHVDTDEAPSTASKPQARQSMGLEDSFKFGKNKGKQLEDVITDDPGYIEWVISEGVVIFDEAAMEAITRKGVA